MFKKFMNLFLILVILALSGCASIVDFSEGRPLKDKSLPTVQVFYDRQGDIYTFESLAEGAELIDNSDNSLICAHDNLLCGKSEFALENNKPLQDSYDDWRQSQTAEIKKTVQRIIAKLENTKNKKIVMLIHGFRVDDARTDYNQVKALIMNNRNDEASPLFIEVHWDGRKSPTLPLSALRVWPPAQWSAPIVGFRIRPLINELSTELQAAGQTAELLVITHSTGAVVAGSLFGNPEAALPCLNSIKDAKICGPNYAEFKEAATSLNSADQVPQWNKLSVVMLAPATTSTTFVVPNQSKLGFQGPSNANLFFSHSKDDNALQKFLKVPQLLGYSGLGAVRKDLEDIEHGLGEFVPKRANVTVMEMSDDLGSAHDWGEYMLSREFYKALQLLWGDT
ncbi:hypothetical protein [Fretibacter rubidus]|uniref:hypothetical protein n=1 Tax=Fretibacter rubidus TaxID=570162 RepID=UPI00352BA04C